MVGLGEFLMVFLCSISSVIRSHTQHVRPLLYLMYDPSLTLLSLGNRKVSPHCLGYVYLRQKNAEINRNSRNISNAQLYEGRTLRFS